MLFPVFLLPLLFNFVLCFIFSFFVLGKWGNVTLRFFISNSIPAWIQLAAKLSQSRLVFSTSSKPHWLPYPMWIIYVASFQVSLYHLICLRLWPRDLLKYSLWNDRRRSQLIVNEGGVIICVVDWRHSTVFFNNNLQRQWGQSIASYWQTFLFISIAFNLHIRLPVSLVFHFTNDGRPKWPERISEHSKRWGWRAAHHSGAETNEMAAHVSPRFVFSIFFRASLEIDNHLRYDCLLRMLT